MVAELPGLDASVTFNEKRCTGIDDFKVVNGVGRKREVCSRRAGNRRIEALNV